MYIYKYHMTQFVAIEWQLVAFRIRKNGSHVPRIAWNFSDSIHGQPSASSWFL